MKNNQYTPTSVRKLVDKFFSLQWCRDNFVVPLYEETSLPMSEGVIKIAIANYSYLGTIASPIKERLKQSGFKCEFIEKTQEEIQEILDLASEERFISGDSLEISQFDEDAVLEAIKETSDNSDDRLWIGQWMHVSFPNSSHTPGNHTLTFEWPDEDFKGKETNFHFGLGYGEVFTNIESESTNVWPHETDNYYKPPYGWIGFSAENGTVGKLEATFGQGFPNYAAYDWQEAVEYAETLTYEGVNGHLATITSKEEAELIFSLLDGQSYWLGGFHNMDNPNYQEPADGWEWVTGENFSNEFWAEGEPNEAGPEDCLEVWGFDKVLNDNRCHLDWTGIVVEFEMNGTNHYEALIPQWIWDDKNETDVLTYVKATPLTDDERNEILKEEGDPDADNDGIVDQFDEDDDNDGILDENDMDDDNDGIDDDSDRCPGTPVGESVDIEGCSSSQILKEVTEDGNIPGFNFALALLSISIIVYSRKERH